MAKVSFKGFNKLEKQTKKLLTKTIQDKKFLSEVGQLAVQNIKTAGLQGKDPESRKGWSKSLSTKTIKKRKELKKYNSVAETYSPRRALVFTGQLYNSIAFKLKGRSARLRIFASGIHRPYKNKDGKFTGKSVKNSDLVKWHSEMGRNVMAISEQTKKSIISLAKRHIKKSLK